MHPYLERLEAEAARAEGVNCPHTFITDDGVTRLCNYCGELVDRPLAIADVLKRNLDTSVESGNGFILCWNRNKKLWRIWENTQFVFESPDEDAAAREFLRRAGGE
jgi:hypothetical protein